MNNERIIDSICKSDLRIFDGSKNADFSTVEYEHYRLHFQNKSFDLIAGQPINCINILGHFHRNTLLLNTSVKVADQDTPCFKSPKPAGPQMELKFKEPAEMMLLKLNKSWIPVENSYTSKALAKPEFSIHLRFEVRYCRYFAELDQRTFDLEIIRRHLDYLAIMRKYE